MKTVRAEGKLSILQSEFSHKRETSKDSLFCEIYDELVEAIEEMDNIENLIIWTAFNTYFRKQLRILDNWNM